MARILHFADLHLDTSFAGVGMSSTEANKRREELRSVLRRIVDKALELNVDVLTIGGDLYEHDRMSLDTGHFLRQQFERLGSRPVFIAPGNHDPYVPASLYRRIEWSENVQIFSDSRWRAVELEDFSLYAVGHTGPAMRKNVLRELRVRPSERAVALFHGSDLSAVPDGKTAHCPFERADIDVSGTALVLLGHYHRHYLWPQENPRLAYPGSPEPLHFGEEGPHYALLVEVTRTDVAVQALQINEVWYRKEQVDVGGMTTSDEVRAAIVGLAPDEEPSSDIVRVELVGQAEADLDLSVDALLASTADCFRYLDIVDKTLPAFDIEMLRGDSTTLGLFVRKIEERMAAAEGDDERRTLEKALRYGLEAFAGQEVRRR